MRHPQPNPDETLTEAEFLIAVLKDKGIVDELTVTAIRLQFAHITRHDSWSDDPSNKVLDDRCVFLELKSQGRIVATSPTAPRTTSDAKDIVQVDTAAPDGGFNEWREVHWLPRVFDGIEHGDGIGAGPRTEP